MSGREGLPMDADAEAAPFFLGSRLVRQLDLGVGGNLYGGRMLDFAAEHGAIYAAKCTGEPHLVGYRFSDFFLPRPVKAGEILDFYAGSPEFGTTSVTFRIAARVGGESALRGVCTFVAVDSCGRKKALSEKRQ